MLWVNIKRILRSGFFNFSRNAFVSLSSVLVMVITLSVLTSLIFVSATLNSTLDALRSRVDVNVYFIPDAPEDQILEFRSRVENLPDVRRVTYVSREQALEEFRERYQNDQIILQGLEEVGGNPLPASLNIEAVDPSQYAGIADFLNQESAASEGSSIISNVNYANNKVAIDNLTSIINAADRMGSVIVIFCVIISVLITLNTIRLAIYVSREEISVMRLVGASSFYIRGPFVVVGTIYGLVAALLTLAMFFPLTRWLGARTVEFFINFNVFDYYTANFGQIFLVVVLSGMVIGAASSFLAVRKYLKV